MAIRMVPAALLALALTHATVVAQTAKPLTLVQQVRAALNDKDFAKAEGLVASQRAEKGNTPEVLAALSWLARGAQGAGQNDRAETLAVEAQTLAVKALAGRSADDDANLAAAIGAGIEVQAQLAV